MNEQLSDEETIRHYLPGQPDQCFETLYKRYVNKVYKRCLSMTRDAEQAQDFTQDIFLKVFSKLDAFQQRSTFSTWLYSIAYNYCADQLRLAKRLTTTPLDVEIGYNVADNRNEHVHEEALHLVQRAMAMLSEEERRLLQLRYEESRGIEEIAQLYGLKASAIKMRLKRSREKVHRLCASHL